MTKQMKNLTLAAVDDGDDDNEQYYLAGDFLLAVVETELVDARAVSYY